MLLTSRNLLVYSDRPTPEERQRGLRICETDGCRVEARR